MADPIGVVGTALGVVSFGLQLYSAVATYIDALDGRKDDLASAHAQLDSLRGSLTTIQSAVSTPSSVSTGTSALLPIVTECKKELDQLEVLLQDLVGSNTSGSKLRERIKTLKFPFRRDGLMKLEDRLQKTNNVFQTALSVLNLNKSLDNERRFSNMEMATSLVPAINTNVNQISTDVQDLRVDVGNMSTNINSAISTMNSNNEILSRLGFSMTQLTATAGQSLPQISDSIASIEQRMPSLPAFEEKLGVLSLHLEQILGIHDLQVQATPQLTFHRLLSKLSQTREIYDSRSYPMSMTNNLGSNSTAAYGWPINTEVRNRSCSCLYRNHSTRTSRRLASLWLRTETIRHEHDQNCELSKLKLGRSRRRFELIVTRPFSFLPWSLGFSFALTTGVGGFSISPNITLRPTIDKKRSLVFRILDTLQWFMFAGSYTHDELSGSLRATKTIILELYRQKKAFANEIVETTKSRETAISRMTYVLRRAPLRSLTVEQYSENQQTPVEALSDMIIELVHAGLPVDGYSHRGRTPVMEVALSVGVFHTKGLLPVLYKRHLTAPDPVRNSADVFWFGRHYRDPYDSSFTGMFDRIRADIFDCGPLSTAITAQKDEEQINDLINASNILEVNSFCQTPLHLAAATGRAKVLSALLRVKDTHDIIHARDTNGNDVFTYTAFYSGVSCHNKKNPVFCFGCCCTSTLDVLLSVDGLFDDYLHSLKGCERLLYHFRLASHSWKLRFFTEIKLRRNELRQLALSYLEDGDIHCYKLNGDGVLDHHGAEVIVSLTEMGIEVPARIRDSFLDPVQCASIYRMLPYLTEHEAQLLFDLGFRDIDEPDELGFTPLMLLRTTLNSAMALMLWFVEHGANLARKLPNPGLKNNHSCPTIAHLMAQKYSNSTSAAAHIMSKIAPVITKDRCKCYCTGSGCTPASILFFHVTGRPMWKDDHVDGSPLRYWQEQQKVTIDRVSRLAKLFRKENITLKLHRHVRVAALRMLTFQALGIRHTCGCRDSDEVPFSADDVEEIRKEDVNLSGLLEKLQTEFENSFDNSGMDFVTFLFKRWIPRMKIVFQELDQVVLSEDERGDAESLGVKWDSCEVQYGPEQITKVDGDFRRPRTLQEYLRAIQKIAEE